jgi:uncharacterized membrane protein
MEATELNKRKVEEFGKKIDGDSLKELQDKRAIFYHLQNKFDIRLLPYDKNTIKEAIESLMQYETDVNRIEHLKVGLLCLDDFIDFSQFDSRKTRNISFFLVLALVLDLTATISIKRGNFRRLVMIYLGSLAPIKALKLGVAFQRILKISSNQRHLKRRWTTWIQLMSGLRDLLNVILIFSGTFVNFHPNHLTFIGNWHVLYRKR